MFGKRKAAQVIDAALDTAAVALHNTGKAVAGEKGEKAAQRVSGTLLGRYLEKCGPACGHCNTRG